MWESVLKSKAHWNVLSRIEERLKNDCEKNGLKFSTHTDGITKRVNSNFKPSNIGQYEFLYGLLERTLRDMAMGSQTIYTKSVSQPAPLGEAYEHDVRLVVEDATFYLYFNCRQTEPSVENIFNCEMSFTVPRKFWGDDDKYFRILMQLRDFINDNGFNLNDQHFAHKCIVYLDIEEATEEATEVVEETETPIEEGTVRERWWE